MKTTKSKWFILAGWRDQDDIALGVGNGVAAGALWGFVFLAPQILDGFVPAQLSAGRYLIYGTFAFVLLIPQRRRLPRSRIRHPSPASIPS